MTKNATIIANLILADLNNADEGLRKWLIEDGYFMCNLTGTVQRLEEKGIEIEGARAFIGKYGVGGYKSRAKILKPAEVVSVGEMLTEAGYPASGEKVYGVWAIKFEA